MLFFSLISIVLILLLFTALTLLADSSLGGLDFTTKNLAAEGVVKILKDRNLSTGLFYDLGSCRGGLSIKLAKALPQLRVVGIDDSGLRTLIAKARSANLKNLSFAHENLFNADISFANVVYIYLPQELMTNLQIKLQKQLKAKSLVITYKVQFPNWVPMQTFNQLFIYQT